MSRASSVEEIEERLEAATPGERWEYDRTGNRLTVVSFQGDNYEHIAEMCGYHDATAVRADAELIAHAPTDLRYLLERVKDLEGALRDVKTVAVKEQKIAADDALGAIEDRARQALQEDDDAE